MKPIINCTLLLLFFTGCFCSAAAQKSSYNFDHITKFNGLSNDKVSAIIQDKEGYYWIATENGLNRFDGSSFKIFYNTGDSNSLTHNHCNSLLEDRNGDIWVGTNRGVSRYIKRTGKFEQIYFDLAATNFEKENRVNRIVSDDSGNIWFSSIGLWKYDIVTGEISSFHHNDDDPSSLSDNIGITSLLYDSHNKGLWVITWNEINFFDLNSNGFYNRRNNPLAWKIFQLEGPGPAILDKKNQLWFQDIPNSKIVCFNIGLNKTYDLNIALNNRGIRCLLTDDKDRIWICYWRAKTEIYDPVHTTIDTGFFSITHPQSAISEKVSHLYIDKNKNYWISSGKGISIYNEENQFYTLFKLRQPTRGVEEEVFRITAIEQTEKNYLWAGTNQGLYKFNLSTGELKKMTAIRPEYIRSISRDNNFLWLAYKDYVLVFDAVKEKVHRLIRLRPHIYFIAKETENEFWVRLGSGGFYIINKNSFDTLYLKERPKTIPGNSVSQRASENIPGFLPGYGSYTDVLSKNNVPAMSFPYTKGNAEDLATDNKGNVWVRTYGAGIFKYNIHDKTSTHYRQKDGLNSNFVNSIVPDQFDNVWVSTADGINYLNTQNDVINNTPINLVFPSNDNINNKLKGFNDLVYFFCEDQIVEINPVKYRPDNEAPKIVISGFKIFEKEVQFSGTDPIELSWEQNFFSFEYSVLKTNPSADQQYAYMLEGFDRNWNYVGKRQYASYTNVPSGKYYFKIKAKNADGRWSNALLSVPVIIHPPFWKTWWFILLSAISIASLIYILFRYRINQLKKVIVLRNKISQDLHDEVASTLSGIRLYSEMAKEQLDKKNIVKVQDSLEIISSNASDMSKDMNDIIWTINPHNDNLKKLLEKLKNYATELTAVKKILFEMNVNDNIENEKLNMEQRRNIYLICKEAVHNGVKYAGAAKIKIDVWKKDGYINILIKDDGTGFNAQKNHDGNGLKNMKERAKEISAGFNLISEYDHGTEIQFRMRL